MTKRTLIPALLTIVLLISGCSQPQGDPDPAEKNTIDSLQWLVGKWQMEAGENIIVEQWQRTDILAMQARTFMTNGHDTLELEKVSIALTDSGLFYIPVVQDQNQGKAVYFRMTAFTANRMTFENPVHDFPQRIIYEFIPPDTLKAAIEGKEEGKERREEFLMKRAR